MRLFLLKGETMQRNNRTKAAISNRLTVSFSYTLLLTLLMSTAVLTGCDHKAVDASKTQVVAKINGKEITIHEVNQYINQMTQFEGTPEQIRKRAIDAVIDQNLLLTAAKKAKLDRDPDVLQSLLASNKKILINAYLARQFTQLPPPSEAALQDYYQSHPALFAERKLYLLDQLSIQASEAQQTGLLARLSASATVGDFIKWLKTQRIPYDEIHTVKAPEDMGSYEQTALLRSKVGEATILRQTQDAIDITVLTSTQPQPLAFDDVKLKIGQILAAAARQQKIAELTQSYRSQAKIEYVGGKD